MIKVLILLAVTGGCTPVEVIPRGDWIIITPEVPKPKTFIEKTWPHWEKPWPSNQVPSSTPWRRPPLQVV
jgi:hypothetical protein